MLTAHIVWFLGSAAAVIAAGIMLSRTADAIAERSGFGHLAVGVVLLAGATTLPEIVTSISAIRLGVPDLAVGNILGACLMNMLILGLLDLLHHAGHRRGLIAGIAVGHARAATLSIILLGVTAVAIITGISIRIGHVGVSTVLLAAIYLMGIRIATRHAEDAPQRTSPEPGTSGMTMRAAVIGFMACAGLLLLACPRLAASAEAIATATGLGATFFGTVFVAMVTTLPEFVATLTALRIGAYDLGVGNLFGSNVFNVSLLFLFDVVYTDGPILLAVTGTHALTALVVIVITGVALLSLLAREERRVWLIEPDAVAILAAGLIGVGLVYAGR